MQENWNIEKATAVIPPLKRLPTLFWRFRARLSHSSRVSRPCVGCVGLIGVLSIRCGGPTTSIPETPPSEFLDRLSRHLGKWHISVRHIAASGSELLRTP